MKGIFIFAFLSVLGLNAIAQNDSIWGIAKDGITLEQITIKADKSNNEIQMKLPQNLIKVDQSFIESNFSGSLMQTLSQIPGIQAVSIGSGQSKPVIRGLGFNRLAVCENGIKHQGQQWGHEHGLEIDQFSVENVEIVKGPAAMLYGSDAIGGVINISNTMLPKSKNETKINLFARSNNRTLGSTIYTGGLLKKFYYKFNFTYLKYSDYIVPTDSIQYYSYYIKLKDNRLRNTAGKECDANLILGYNGKLFKNCLSFSNVYSKSGFFANAHGIEIRLSEIDFDKSFRDIDYPYSFANHLKIQNNSVLKIKRSSLCLDLAFQINSRKEYSEPVSHGYMPKPDGFLERMFDKKTYSANLNYKTILGNHSFNAGVSSEIQDNTVGGWGYIMPDFLQKSAGVFMLDKWHINSNLTISVGTRIDNATLDISEYHDWYLTPNSNGIFEYLLRSPRLSKNWNSFIYSAGINWKGNNWVLKANSGKSFRIPIASELGADGVNYQIFRYEKGNPNLNPEESYQIDFGVNYERQNFNISFTPFINYFPNYIYLCPDYHYIEGLQLYEYVQCEVFRTGTELQTNYTLNHIAEFSIGGEYLFARQISGDKKGYGLPFSQPWSILASAKYYIPQHKRINECFLYLIYKYTGAQNDIVPPEKLSEGYHLVNMAFGKIFVCKKIKYKAELSIQNLFDTKYYNHTSYYRLIDVPEPGRNFSVILGIEF